MQQIFVKNKWSFKTRQKKIERQTKKRKNKQKFDSNRLVIDYFNFDPPLLEAPENCELLKNTSNVLRFVHAMRHSRSIGKIRGVRAIRISLKNVKQIDFAALNIIKAIGEDLRLKAILMSVDLPNNIKCKQYLIESGFLDYMFDKEGKKHPKGKASDEIIFEKGYGKLTTTQNKKISQIIQNSVFHLTGNRSHFSPLKKTILEICGNSIEHAYSKSGQWALSVKYEDTYVLFTVTDLGRGILDTLYRKYLTEIREVFKSRDQILLNAFIKKYGSSTKEENRSKGLPMIKIISEKGLIEDLLVVTNDVFLPLDSKNSPVILNEPKTKFRGTFYEWKVSKQIINKYKNEQN
jgi:hypothetical protein